MLSMCAKKKKRTVTPDKVSPNHETFTLTLPHILLRVIEKNNLYKTIGEYLYYITIHKSQCSTSNCASH